MNIICDTGCKNIRFLFRTDGKCFIIKGCGKVFAFRVINIQDSRGIFFPVWPEKPGEKSFFTIKVFIHAFVIIHVILSQVREYTCIKSAVIHPVKVKPVGRDFHDDMGNTGVFHVMKGSLKINGIRCCHRVVKNLMIISDIDGSDDTG